MEDRAWWGGLWADRVVSALAGPVLERGLTTMAEVEEIAGAWRRWTAAADGWFVIVNGEVLCTP